MESQRKRPVFVLISERELHFIPVAELFRAGFHALKYILSVYRFIHKPADLPFLHLHLFFIGHGLVHTSTARREDTAHRLSRFEGRLLQHFQQTPLRIPPLKLVDHKADFLSGDPVLYRYIFFFFRYIYDPFIREIHSLNNTFECLSFFHTLLHIQSARGRILPLPNHRDTSLISRHRRSMVSAPLRSALSEHPPDVQRRCPSDARSCEHGGRSPGVSRKNRQGAMFCIPPSLFFSCSILLSGFIPDRLR